MSMRITRLFQPGWVVILSAVLMALAVWLVLLAGGLAQLALLAPFRWNV